MDKVLSLFTDPAHNTPLVDFLGACVAILGIRGSGKSNSAARLIEQMLSAGLPLTIVDVLGEYWGLKEKHAIFVVGKSAHVNVDIEIHDAEQAAAIAVWSLQERVSVILDVSDHDDDTRLSLLKGYFEALWKTAGQLRRPYQIVLEEAHNWCPQGVITPVKSIFTRIAAEGRSRGLSIVMVSQRSARVDKNVLTQAGILFLHRVQHGQDLDVYSTLIPSNDRKFVKTIVPKLETGQCVFVSKDGFEVVRILKRETFHAGVTPGMDELTPGMDEVKPPSLTSVSADMLASVRQLIGPSQGRKESDQEAVLRSALQTLRQENEAQAHEIARLQAEVARLTLIVQPAPVLEVAAVQSVTAVGPQTSTTPPVWQAQRQTERFESFLSGVKSTEPMHRLTLRYLAEHPDTELTLADLAPHIGYEADTVRKNPPTRLLNMNLVQRRKVRGKWHYSAKLTSNHLKTQFPDLRPDVMLQRLSAVCQS